MGNYFLIHKKHLALIFGSGSQFKVCKISHNCQFLKIWTMNYPLKHLTLYCLYFKYQAMIRLYIRMVYIIVWRASYLFCRTGESPTNLQTVSFYTKVGRFLVPSLSLKLTLKRFEHFYILPQVSLNLRWISSYKLLESSWVSLPSSFNLCSSFWSSRFFSLNLSVFVLVPFQLAWFLLSSESWFWLSIF